MKIDSMNSVIRSAELNMDKANAIQRTTPAQVEVQKSKHEEYNGIEISERMLIKTIEKANKELVIANRALEFSVHEKTKEIIVRVIDVETKEVVREIPSEKILDMLANMLELAGILVDERR